MRCSDTEKNQRSVSDRLDREAEGHGDDTGDQSQLEQVGNRDQQKATTSENGAWRAMISGRRR